MGSVDAARMASASRFTVRIALIPDTCFTVMPDTDFKVVNRGIQPPQPVSRNAGFERSSRRFAFLVGERPGSMCFASRQKNSTMISMLSSGRVVAVGEEPSPL